MQASGKVIMFKASGRMPYRTFIEEAPMEELSSTEEASLMEKVMKVLDDAEGEWEMDHNALALREKFHLLRHYLKRLHHV
jgi:arginyl-tRNA--protein-N-Asp/Glu arginylyltransferase